MKFRFILLILVIVVMETKAQTNEELMIAEVESATRQHHFLSKDKIDFVLNLWKVDRTSLGEYIRQYPQKPTLDEECDTLPYQPWVQFDGVKSVVKHWMTVDSTSSIIKKERVLKSKVFAETLFVWKDTLQ